MEYAKEIADSLQKEHIRCEAELSDNHMNKKIKYFRSYRVPYVVVVGDNEMENRTVSVNIRGGKQMKDIPLNVFVDLCKSLSATRALHLAECKEDI